MRCEGGPDLAASDSDSQDAGTIYPAGGRFIQPQSDEVPFTEELPWQCS